MNSTAGMCEICNINIYNKGIGGGILNGKVYCNSHFTPCLNCNKHETLCICPPSEPIKMFCSVWDEKKKAFVSSPKKKKNKLIFICSDCDKNIDECNCIEEEKECFGKHCSNTNNLNLGKCWSRHKQTMSEELICEDCWEQETKIKCVGCWETYTYDKVKMKPQSFPWGSCRENQNFYCLDCIKDITERVCM